MGKAKFSPSVEAKEKKTKPKFSPSIEVQKEEESSPFETAQDFAYGAAQGATFNMADEAYGAGRSLLENGDLSDYEQYRDHARAKWDEARERSPWATVGGEVTGAVVSPANRIFGPVTGLRGIIRGGVEGAAQGYGASDKEDIKGQAIDAGKGGLIGGATGVVANAITKRYSKSPDAMRSEVLGVKPKDYRVDGPADRKQIVERIKESGMLKNRKMEYDPEKMQFVPKGKTKWTLDELEKNTEDRLLQRSEDAVEKLQERKERYFGKLLDNRFVPGSAIDQLSTELMDEYSKRGLHKGPFDRNAAVAKIKENILDQIVNLGGDPNKISLRVLDQVKRMAQEDVKNFSKGLGELGDTDELMRITSRKLKNLVQDKVGHADFKKINEAQHDFLTIGSDLKNKIKNLELAAPPRQHLEKTNAAEGILDSVLGGSQGRLSTAARKEWYQSHVPAPVRAVIPYAAEEVPGAVFRERFLGKEPQVQVIENDPGHPMNPMNPQKGRMPQSVPNIPEQFIRTPLPRNTQELLQKKNFVLGKVAQMMPEMFEAVQDTYDHEPERIGEIAQVLAMKMPHLFERDKYNRFDGRILSEKDKAQAIKDTLLRQDLDSIAQAKIITKLNKEGLYDGN